MTTHKKEASTDNNKNSENQQDTTVRGSGYTYDENKGQTDQSIPLDEADTDNIVILPNLGKPNRP
jgi:hypothetical protein